MQNTNTPGPNNFEFSIFEIITDGHDCNTRYYNHQLDKLYVKYRPMAIRLAGQYHLDSSLVDDILQDGILLLLDRIKDGRFEFNPEYGFKSFLFRTFLNLSMNANKKRSNFPTKELLYFNEVDREEADYIETYHHIAPSCSLEERVEELLEKNLGDSAAMVLYLALIENKSNGEGASIMKYKNEAVFRKKKSKHLRDFRKRIGARQKHELMRMAS